jgi:hypothetical protein
MRYFISLLLLSSCALAQSKSFDPDGYSWVGWSKDFKLGYVSGYLQATDTAQAVEMATCLMTLNYLDSAKVSLDKWSKMCQGDSSNSYDGIGIGQFVDGAEIFYRDFRNMKVETSFAFQYVRDQIKGKAAKDLDAELTLWRQCSADHSKCLTDH